MFPAFHGLLNPDAPLPVDGQVVGRVQPLPVQPVDNGRGRPVGIKADDGSSSGAAPVQPALGVEGEAVGMVGVFPVQGALAGVGVVRHDSAFGDVREQKASAVPGGPFGQAAEGSGDVLPLQCHIVLLDQVGGYGRNRAGAGVFALRGQSSQTPGVAPLYVTPAAKSSQRYPLEAVTAVCRLLRNLWLPL